MTKRIGFLGGSFDPPHLGHLMLGETARDILSLDKVLYAPVFSHPIKSAYFQAPPIHRITMLDIATGNNPAFSTSRVDFDRPGPYYSVDTLKILSEEYQGATLYFIIGGDNFKDIHSFYKPEAFTQFAELAVIKRSGEKILPNMHEGMIPGLKDHVTIIDLPMLSIWLSSTEIRDRLRRGMSVRYIVPDEVLLYIHKNNLYGVNNH